MRETFDDKITEALKKGTENAVKYKDKVWEGIRIEIEPHYRGVRRMSRKNKKSNKLPKILGTGAVAAVLAFTFFNETHTGRAAIDKIKEMFVPEKQIVQEIEGSKEDTSMDLKESKMGYILYIDEERYYMEQKDGVDRIVAKHQPENAPEVYMEISQVEDKSPEELAGELKSKLKSEVQTFKDIGRVSEPLDAIFFYGLNGSSWDSKVVKYYLVDNTKGGTFVIKQQYFFEAAEGHGVRLDNILKEFRIVEIEE